jgi:hypothetical protein
MKQPATTFSLEIGECLNLNDNEPLIVDIIDKNEKVLCCFAQEGSLQDAEYMVESWNNYQRALELLQFFVDKVESGKAKSFETYNIYKSFLNELK